MTTQLPERLRALAEEAPESLSGPALWQAGRRRHRMRVVTAMAVTGGLVLALAALGFGDWQSRRPDPAAPPATQSGPMSIPDRFFTPSPWLPSTSKPGRLVAVIELVTRQHLPSGSDDSSVVGVAAGSQRYTFLDLPGRTASSDVSLAPDGLHLAYVIDGTTSEDREPYAGGGLAVLDLLTGHLETADIPSEHGLNIADVRWAGTSTALLQVTRVYDGVGHHQIARATAFGWTLGDPAPVRLGDSIGYGSDAINVPGAAAYLFGPRTAVTVDPVTGEVIERIRLSQGLHEGTALSSDRRRIAGVRGPGSPGPLVAGEAGRHAEMHRVPGRRHYLGVLSWPDPQHVVAVRVRQGERRRHRLLPGRDVSLDVVDVDTGRGQPLSYLANGWTQFAADAVQHPTTVAAIAPPHPWNRRVELWTLLSLAVVGGCAFVLVRFRRVRR